MSVQPSGLSLSQLNVSGTNPQQNVEAPEDSTATVAQKLFAKGVSYELGAGQEINLVEACKCYEEAAKQDSIEGLVRLAFFRTHGIGCRMDKADAQRLLSRAAELGSVRAMAEVGFFYCEKYGKSHQVEDADKALFYMRKVCENREIETAAIRSICIFKMVTLEAELGRIASEDSGRVLTKMIRERNQILREASDHDDICSLEFLGMIHRSGVGSIVPKDLDRAFVYFQRAADLGRTEAFIDLAKLLTEEGRQLPVDSALIRKWTETAERDHHPGAQYLMGRLFWAGVGVEKDDEEAVRYFRMAADNGVYKAVSHLYELEVFHRPGLVLQGEDLRWAKVAADQKNPEGIHKLGLLYLTGNGVEKDVQKAMDCFRTAFSLGNAEAGDYLCKVLSEGTLVPQDMRAASEIARSLDSQHGAYERDRLMHRLSVR